jgi:hypothetical protein
MININTSKGLELTYYHHTYSEEFDEYYNKPYLIEYKWLYFPNEAECEVMCVGYEDEDGNFSFVESTGDKYLDRCIDTYMRENAEWVSQYE